MGNGRVIKDRLKGEEDLRRLVGKGLSNKEIAEKLDKSLSSICRRLQRIGLRPNPPNKALREKVQEYHSEGLLNVDIASRLKIHRSTVGRLLKKMRLMPNRK